MTKRNAIIGIIVLALVFLGLGFWYQNRGEVLDSGNDKSEVKGFTLEKPNFVVQGSNLTAVEIWATPTGTDVKEEDNIKVGNATLTSDIKGEQVWTLAIPEEPFLATGIFAKGFDRQGGEVNRKTLSLDGATEVYNALWGTPGDEEISEVVTLKIGESKNVAGLTIKPIRIVEDNRCPFGVECIWAGRVAVEIEVGASGKSETKIMYSDEDRVIEYEGYKIDMVDVKPDKPGASTVLKPTDYRIVFKVWRE
jgi:hypothetical protein